MLPNIKDQQYATYELEKLYFLNNRKTICLNH